VTFWISSTVLADTLKNFGSVERNNLSERVNTNYRKFVARRNHRKLWTVPGYVPDPAAAKALIEGIVFAAAGAKTGFVAENAIPLYVATDDPQTNVIYWDIVVGNGAGHEFNGVYALHVGLCLFNDVILREATRFRVPVIDPRLICVEPQDYSAISPIEPSSLGGRKIVCAIASLMQSHDFLEKHCLLPTKF